MKQTKIIFRSDGDSQNGLGHMFRLFAFYEMLEQNYECLFLTKDNSTLTAIPPSINFKCIPHQIAPENEADWLSERFDPSEFLLIVDGYQYKDIYQSALKKKGYTLVYVDDLCDWHMYADLVINHSPSASKMLYSKEKYTRMALGTDYALLRASFLKCAINGSSPPDDGTVFIAFGGADPLQLTQKIGQAISQLPEVKRIDIVQGAAAKNLESFSKYNDKIIVHTALNEVQLLDVMKSCKMAIVPTSTVLFELCCVNRPIVAGYYAENQRSAYNEFVDIGAVMGLGDYRALNIEQLLTTVRKCLQSDPHRMIEKQRQLFDGKQRERIIDLIKDL